MKTPDRKRARFLASVVLVIASLALLCFLWTCPAKASEPSILRYPVLNDSGLSKRQILKMGLEAFLIHCSARYRLHSDETACVIYSHYKGPDNNRRIGQLTAQQRRQLKQVYNALQHWQETALRLRYDITRGGLVWINNCACSPAFLDECMGKVIDIYANPRVSTLRFAGKSSISNERVFRP